MSENKVFRVLILPGDHVGPEIMAEALKVLDIIEASRPDIRFERDTDIVGGCSIDKHGTPVTDAVLEKALASDAVLFGSIGGPEWAGVDPTPESGLLKLRQRLDAFANLRPCEILVPSLVSASPIKAELVAGTKFIVVRENCGGAYFGKKEESEDEASDLWIYSRPEVERLARVSAAVARILHASSEKKNDGSKPVVWSADKANVLASGRLWRRATTDIFNKELTDIDLRHQLADSLAMLMVLDPKRFNNSVIHTDNTFGDVLSDISGGITGTLGVLPSASLAGVPGEGSCKGIYEPVHGSAPDISGKNLANPVAQILSLAMMLRYSFLLEKEADAIEQSVAKVLDTKEGGGLEIRTKDLGVVTMYGFDFDKRKFVQAKGYRAKDRFASLEDSTDAGLAFDVIVDFVGHSITTSAAIRAVKPGGKVITGLNIVGSIGASMQDLKNVLALLAEGKDKPELTEIAFEEIPETIKQLANGTVAGRDWTDPSKTLFQ
ncbi:3-isopropylmalate dehydrogenase [Fusarium pseudoanthophilum]|uniref:3-isopropylmalate dehydrogenase n=1 Tax=Fusarium pseudoanthophilum TaxID=48495 RepID=A0A8H5L2R4_9HYPO|nr:3-isopropylmalate dehydrogenase [Fusarium pseudoanthophilum]